MKRSKKDQTNLVRKIFVLKCWKPVPNCISLVHLQTPLQQCFRSLTLFPYQRLWFSEGKLPCMHYIRVT